MILVLLLICVTIRLNMDKKVSDFIKAMDKRKLTLALAESITCGLVSYKLGNGIGTSKIFNGSIVCYTPEVKINLFKVSPKMIREYSTESMQVTEKLVKNLPKLIKADIHAAVTGLASEGGSESKNKPVGTVFFCFSFRNKVYRLKKKFNGTPMEIKEKTCLALFDFIRSKL